MNIASYFSPGAIIFSFVATILFLTALGKVGLIRNAFDPFMLMHIQLLFTSILLFLAELMPLSQIFYLTLTYSVWTFFWRGGFKSDVSRESAWIGCVWLLIAISVPANLFLLLTKGFILFQEDVGAAKVEFYQGVGIIRRINTALAVILPIYIFSSWCRSHAWSIWLTAGIGYAAFVILSLGSKAGITSLAFSYGAVLYFQRQKQSLKSVVAILIVSIVSSFGMFYLVYGNDFLIDFGIRMVAFSDGPFYYFKEKMKIDVPFAYPYYIFAYAARLIDFPPISALGPEINWRYFGLDDDLYGPNPQISVESVAIYGDAAVFHYLTYVLFAFLFSKLIKNPYSFALWATFLRSFPVDSQLAYSNLYNILFVLLIYGLALALQKFIAVAARPRLDGAS